MNPDMLIFTLCLLLEIAAVVIPYCFCPTTSSFSYFFYIMSNCTTSSICMLGAADPAEAATALCAEISRHPEMLIPGSSKVQGAFYRCAEMGKVEVHIQAATMNAARDRAVSTKASQQTFCYQQHCWMGYSL